MKLRPLLFLVRSLLIFILPLLLIYLLIATNPGLQCLAWLAQRFIPGLQQLHVQGQLTGPIYLQNSDYRDQDIVIHLQQATLDWHPKSLLKGNLIIQTLQVNGLKFIILNTNSKQKKSEEPTNYNWLKHLWIKHIQLQNITIAPGNIHLQVAGSITEQWQLQWQLQLQNQQAPMPANGQVSQLENVLQTIRGNLIANGTVQGAKLAAKITAIFTATDLIVAQVQAAKLHINITTDLCPAMNSDLVINASRLQYKDYCFATANFQAQGQINPQFKLAWQLRAKLLPVNNYRGVIRGKGLVQGRHKTPKLTANVQIQQGQFATLKFNEMIAQVNADLTENTQSQLQISVNNLHIKQYQFAPMQLQAVLNRGQQSLILQLAAGAVRYQLTEKPHRLTWQTSSLQVVQQAQGLIATGQLILNAQQYIKLNLQLPDYQFPAALVPTQIVRGKISLYVQQIAPFLSSVTMLQNVSGILRADLQITGTYKQPQLLGSITLNNAAADVPELNLQIRNIQLRAQGSPNNNIAWSGQAQSGAGILYLAGSTALYQQDFPTQLTLQGSNILISNTNHYHIIAAPDLQASYTDKRLMITGTIKLPAAQINLGGTSGTAVELSKDVVFVHAEQPATALLPLYAKIQLKLGDAVQLCYEGLSTQLRGQVMINEMPSHPTTGIGQINFYQGSYTYYGQTLNIQPGSRIIFNGAIDNPLLNIQAAKQVEIVPTIPTSASDLTPTSTDLSSSAALPGATVKGTVGVSVQGNIRNPQVTLFSQPIMDQIDILSYLLTGRPSGQLGAGSAGVLFDAVSSLNFGGTSQFKDIMNQLQKSVGLDQFGLQSSSYLDPTTNQAQQNTALVLGKALSPKLYISYSVGILEALNTLQIRYMLSKYWTLQSTTSSLDNGVDLLYMIERGK